MPGADATGAAGLMLAAAAATLAAQAPAIDGAVQTVAPVHARHRPADSRPIAVSADGRFVAFASYARLTEHDVDDSSDVYVLDRATRGISLESPPVDFYRNGAASSPSISSDGRFVVYVVSGGQDRASRPESRVILRDRSLATSRAVEPVDRPLDADTADAQIAANGEAIVFATAARTLEDSPRAAASQQIFVVERSTWRFEKVSVGPPGQQFGTGSSFGPSISADGRFVAFSWRPRLADPRADRRHVNVYLRDRARAVTTPIGMSVRGNPPNGPCYRAMVSADGRYVSFVSEATDLTRERDRNNAPDVFLRDTSANTTQLISRRATGGAANGMSSQPAVTADGRFVVFESDASDILCARRCGAHERDTNLVGDAFVLDRQTGTTRRLSRGRSPWIEPSIMPAIDGAGNVIAFLSRHPMDALDDRDDFDLFLWESGAGPPAAEAGTPGARRR